MEACTLLQWGTWESREPPNDEMQRTRPSKDGASPLISGCLTD